MSQLNIQSLSQLPKQIRKPTYDVENTGRGIVHLGPGAFHRAHQAVYTDLAMSASGGNWKIDAVSLRSQDLRDKLATQDNLYSLVILDENPYIQAIAAFNNIFVLGDQREQVMSSMCDALTHIISLTITEKGYCLDSAGELDWSNSDIQKDKNSPDKPVSAIGLLVAVLKERKNSGADQLTIISCDNLSDNGTKLGKAVVTFANVIEPELGQWIASNICFPNTMVDSITPATSEELKQQTEKELGVEDAWPIQREAFTQWVIEDNFSGPRPDWEKVGVTFTQDVYLYEKAKLRVLNGTHSTLAYVGRLCDLETVYQAISEPSFEAFIRKLLVTEILPSIGATQEMDLAQYADDILQRYHNKHIRHFLSQIAWDGSQKLPFRILNTIRDNIQNKQSISLLCIPIAAWSLFILKQHSQGQQLVDPLAPELLELADKYSTEPLAFVDEILNLKSVFAELSNNSNFRSQVKQHVTTLANINKQNFAQILDDLT
ncbi:mannitol dehydrogenase family protein [Paraglaciecola arctica]|uniref:Fructuronate reductase n=1 Tax=Paraglaciecola arctica BSs20135 TaxID=493475 RepID=K6YDL4_9ALTE|nr:mannitol dehydrogenase family protein [Paraglaciecola arctica]GAC22051.1 fructuronate reductase [Paraglaciecola arctica BSs20135]